MSCEWRACRRSRDRTEAATPSRRYNSSRRTSPRSRVGRVIVDLQDVTFLDSTTLALLVREHRRLQSAGHELIVLVGEQTPLTVFAVTGIDRILTIRPAETSRLVEPSTP